MEQSYLSDIELYYSKQIELATNSIKITGDECKHIQTVMRHKIGDFLFVTDGNGKIYKSEITSIEKKIISTSILETFRYENRYSNITFCFPRLKSADRFEFALEKCIELGITNFMIYQADRSVAKGEKLVRWNKIAISAMKQSLRSFIPKISFVNSIKEIPISKNIFMFDQKAKSSLRNEAKNTIAKETKLVFGAEGGFSEKEIEFLRNSKQLKLTENRLRAETAVVTAAAQICITG